MKTSSFVTILSLFYQHFIFYQEENTNQRVQTNVTNFANCNKQGIDAIQVGYLFIIKLLKSIKIERGR